MEVRLEREKGLGLIDTVVGMVLLGIMSVALLAGFRYISRGSRDNTGRIQAIMLAQETLETYKEDYDGVTEDKFPLPLPAPPPPVSRNGFSYNFTVASPDVSFDAMSNLKPLQLTVTWDENGVTRSLNMVEYIYLKK